MAEVYPPLQPAPAKRRNWKLIGGIVAGTIVLMCACLAAAANSGNKIIASQTATAQAAAIANALTAEPTLAPESASLPAATLPPQPTDTPAPTTAPEPMPTEAPTNTIIPPTIEVPTIALPTVAPEVGVSQEVRTYFAEAAPIISDYGEALSDLGNLSTRAGQEPALMLSTDWKIDTAVALAELRDAANRMDPLDAGGSEAQPLDNLLQQIADETEPMTIEDAEGVDEVNVDKLTSAAARMKTINGLIDQMQVELAKLLP